MSLYVNSLLMRKFYLFLLLIIVSVTIKAQNWQTVYSDRVQYFDSGVNAIKIISKQVDNNGDSIFFNYPALYIDTLNYRVDDRKSDSVSWLGKRIIIKPNGENHFVNGLNDTLKIKTNARNKESWELLRNSNTLIIAKVDSISYGNYNGFIDSVKHISLSVVANSSQYQNMVKELHNKQIWLSQYNGFLRVPILEYIVNLGWNKYYYNSKPLYNQTKINLFTNKNMFDFGVGDIIHSSESSNFLYTGNSVYNGYSRRWSLDTYIKKNYDSIGDSVQYQIERRNFFLIDRKNPDTTYISSDTTLLITRTYYNLSKQAFSVMPFSIGKFIDVTGTASLYTGFKCATDFSIIRSGSCFLPSIRQNEINTFEQYFNLEFVAKKGLNYIYQDGSNGALPPNPYTIRSSITYVKNSCGGQGKDVTLVVEKTNRPNSLNIYPNPATSKTFVVGEGIKQVCIKDIQGKVLKTILVDNVDSLVLDLLGYSSGIYFVSVLSLHGVYNIKLVIR